MCRSECVCLSECVSVSLCLCLWLCFGSYVRLLILASVVALSLPSLFLFSLSSLSLSSLSHCVCGGGGGGVGWWWCIALCRVASCPLSSDASRYGFYKAALSLARGVREFHTTHSRDVRALPLRLTQLICFASLAD